MPKSTHLAHFSCVALASTVISCLFAADGIDDRNLIPLILISIESVCGVQRDGEPWFVLRDVCQILGMSNSRMVADRLEDDEKGVSQIDTLGGKQTMVVINESGLYNVILRSDKPEAKPFRKWVTSEVLPSIRKHGAYMTTETKVLALIFSPFRRGYTAIPSFP